MKIVVPKRDLSGASILEMLYDINRQETILLRPTHMIVPDYMRAQYLQILNAEFDKGYTTPRPKM